MSEYEKSKLANQIMELNANMNKQNTKSWISDKTAMIISLIAIIVIVGIALI